VVIYPTRSTEQSDTLPYQALLNSQQMHRVYLDQLGQIEQLPLGLALMVLTTVEETEAAAKARSLLARSQQVSSPETSRVIMEMLTTIIVYKFTNLSRREVEQMLGITLQETRVYQEAKEEGKQEGRQEGLQEGERSLISLLLQQKVGTLPQSLDDRISLLSIQQLESLAIALLNFSSLNDLAAWLDANQSK
jgi:predicted transposase/invertase (TIGR01784 family)